MKTFRIVLFLLLALVPALEARAGRVEFVKEHTYRAGDMDSKISSRAIALLEVKRALLEQLGTYLVSETEVRNYQMTKDQVTLLTAGIVSAEILEEKWDGREFTLKAKLVVDPQEVAERVKAMSRDRERTRELEEAKTRIDHALREVERLKKDIGLAGLAQQEDQRQADRQVDYSRAVRELGTEDWYSGHRFLMKDGSFFVWTNYEESADSYCTQLSAGRVCVLMKDVASIRIGAYPEKTEVISGRTTEEPIKRKADRDKKTGRKDNARNKTAAAQEQSGKPSVSPRQDRKQVDIDAVMKNANEGTVFR